MSILDAPFNPIVRRSVALPAGLGWDSTTYPISPSIVYLQNGRTYASVGMTAQQMFALKSTAYSAPAVTYWVDRVSGVDTNNGLTSGAAFKSIWKAILAANTGGVAAKIMVKGGASGAQTQYFRSVNPWFNNGAGNLWATVDLALVAYGGRVNSGTWDEFAAPGVDATFTNCYSFAVAGADRVVDRLNINRFGSYTELLNVATPTLCNAIPNSWCHTARTLYVNRADKAAVTNANTRLYRNSTESLIISAQKNIYVGAADADSGFDFEGGFNAGVASLINAAPGATRNLAVFENVTFSQAGGASNPTLRAVSMESWNGMAAFFNCHAAASQSDLYNLHNTFAAPTAPHMLLVNCTGVDAGRGSNQSNNGLTAHEDAVLVVLGGQFEATRGGMVRCIGSSKTLLAGVRLRNDLGDLMLGGAFRPTAVSAADTAQIWCDTIDIEMPAGGRAYCTEAPTAKVYRRNCPPAPQPDVGPGTFSTY